MKKSHLITAVVIAAVLVGVGLFAMTGDDETAELPVNDDAATTELNQDTSAETDPAVSEVNDELEEVEPGEGFASFDVSMSNFEFSETELRVSPGDEVTIFLQTEEGTHDFVIDEFDAQSPVLNSGENAEFTFTVPEDASGEYEFYCSIGNHRALGMVGTLIVE